MTRLLDLSGQRFGRWTVRTRASNTSGGQARWVCECQCKTIRAVLSSSLVQGKSLDCGCGRLNTLTARLTSHNQSKGRTYTRWCDMKQRVRRHPAYTDVSICARWADFTNFIADMGECPPGYSLERIDVYGAYTPKNCTWIPKRHQPKNKRNSIKYEYLGRTRCVLEWCEVLGLNRNTVYARIYRGWSTGAALELEPRTQT